MTPTKERVYRAAMRWYRYRVTHEGRKVPMTIGRRCPACWELGVRVLEACAEAAAKKRRRKP